MEILNFKDVDVLVVSGKYAVKLHHDRTGVHLPHPHKLSACLGNSFSIEHEQEALKVFKVQQLHDHWANFVT